MSIWTDLTPFTLKIKRIEIGVNRIKFQKELHFYYIHQFIFLGFRDQYDSKFSIEYGLD